MLADIGAADFVVAHNAKFELQWLHRCGVDLRKILPCCTFLAEWVIHGNIKVEMSLAAIAKRYGVPPKLDLVSKLIDSGYPVEDIPSSWLLEYCQRDVETTLAVFEQQRRVLEETNRLHIWHTRNLTCAVLADIEANGMRLDETRVNEEYSRVTKRHDELKKELESFCGGINLASPKQVAEFLYDKLGFAEGRERTPTGGRKADAETLLGLKATTPEQRRFKELYGEYRNLDSLLSKNLNFFKGVVDEREGLFYAQFNQGRTATHRLASSGRSIWFEHGGTKTGVQFQNQPREYKRLFRAKRDNWLLGECDGSALEFRIAAEIGKDSIAKHEIETKVDIHTNTKDFFTNFGEPISRQEAKPLTFKPLFAGEGSTKSEKAYCKFFRKKYKELDTSQHNWALEVLEKKRLVTPLGMHYFWPDTRLEGSYGKIRNKTSIYNYPIQGTATAEILPIALVYFWHRIAGLSITILNTIHDSILAEVPPELVETFRDISVRSLTMDVFNHLKTVYNYEFKVPLGVGIKISPHWGDTKEELAYDIYPDGTGDVTNKQTKEVKLIKL